MILLDTDHLTVLKYPFSPRCISLVEKLDSFERTVAFLDQHMR